MSEKLYSCLQQNQNPDSLDLRLKEKNSFNNSIQKIKDIQIFFNHEAKKYKRNLKNIQAYKRFNSIY